MSSATVFKTNGSYGLGLHMLFWRSSIFSSAKMPNVTYSSSASTHRDSAEDLDSDDSGTLEPNGWKNSFSREVSIRSKLRTRSDSPLTLTGSLMAATALITPKMIAAEAMSALIMSGQSRRQRPPLLKVVPCPRDEKSNDTIICIIHCNGWIIKWLYECCYGLCHYDGCVATQKNSTKTTGPRLGEHLLHNRRLSYAKHEKVFGKI